MVNRILGAVPWPVSQNLQWERPRLLHFQRAVATKGFWRRLALQCILCIVLRGRPTRSFHYTRPPALDFSYHRNLYKSPVAASSQGFKCSRTLSCIASNARGNDFRILALDKELDCMHNISPYGRIPAEIPDVRIHVNITSFYPSFDRFLETHRSCEGASAVLLKRIPR